MADIQKVVEKHYIEIPGSAKKKFLNGLLGGLGYSVGFTVGTTLLLLIIGFFLSRIDLQPILGQFLADVIKAAQPNLRR